MIYSRNGKVFELLISFDDGCKEDIRIADLLRKYNLPGLFYVPSSKRELTDHQVKELAKDFQIGSHTKNHRILRSIPPPDAEAEIRQGKWELERLIGKQIHSFCYPRGRFNDQVKDMVKAVRFDEARTTRVFATKRSEDPFELDTTIHIYPRKEYNGEHWLTLAKDYFYKASSPEHDEEYFHLWGHGFELEKYDAWQDFETMLRFISRRLHQQR